MNVTSHQSTEQIQSMRTHAEHIKFQIENLSNDEEILSSVSASEDNYLQQVAQLVNAVFVAGSSTEQASAHQALLNKLAHSQSYIQENATDYRMQQQLAELFFDLQLLLARKNPLNTLKTKKSSAVIYTSCQHQFDIASLVEQINQRDGAFINPITQKIFNKRDQQLIKLAAKALRLVIKSQAFSQDSKAQMARMGLENHAIKIIPGRNLNNPVTLILPVFIMLYTGRFWTYIAKI